MSQNATIAASSFTRCARDTRSRAMTLVELLVALTILVAMTTLVAALWSQMRAWRTENARMGEGLRPQRVAEFMRRQWSERRAVVPLETSKGVVVSIDQNALEFITAAPALFPDWPLVRARYVIEREENGKPPQEWPSKLTYEETRVTSMDRVLEDQNDTLGEPAKRSVTLLTGCRDVRWEKWAGWPSGALVRPPSPEDDVAAMVWAQIQTRESVVSQDAAQKEPNGDGDQPAGAKSKRTRPDPSQPPVQEPAGQQEALQALRLTGMIGKEEFAWPFIVEALR